MHRPPPKSRRLAPTGPRSENRSAGDKPHTEKSRRRQPHGIVRREEAGQLFGGFPLLGDLDRQGFHPIDIDTDLPAEDLEGSFVLQLIDVTALFAGGLVIGMSAIEHPLRSRPVAANDKNSRRKPPRDAPA